MVMRVKEAGESQCCIVMMQIQTYVWHESEPTSSWSPVARKFGEQSFKQSISEKEVAKRIEEELADIFFVLVCMSNQMNINITFKL